VQHLSASNDDLAGILIAVRNEVIKETHGQQVPWENSALTGRFYFDQSGQAAHLTTGMPSRRSEAAEAWSAVERTTNISALEQFIGHYKETFYADLARVRIDELKGEGLTSPTNYWVSKPIPAWSRLDPLATSSDPSPWVKLCERQTVRVPDASGKETPINVNLCSTGHETLDGDTGAILVSVVLREINGIGQHLVVTVPLGVIQSPGVRVSILSWEQWEKWAKRERFDESAIPTVNIPIILCNATGCQGQMLLTPGQLVAFKNGAGLAVTFLPSSLAATALPVPLAGFNQAQLGAPVDNNSHAQARKNLVDQIKARHAATENATKQNGK
jgi:invasion protein IalB